MIRVWKMMKAKPYKHHFLCFWRRCSIPYSRLLKNLSLSLSLSLCRSFVTNPPVNMYDKDQRREKHKKWCLYGLVFIIFQTGIIVLFTLTVMKVRNPKFRVIRSTEVGTSGSPTTSFNLSTNVELGIKNTNFGPYKYDSSTIKFLYGETEVGSAIIPKSKAQFRRTKKFTVPVVLASTSVAANSLSSGIIPLRCRSTLNGKVELIFIFKKKKAVNMDCTMEINTNTKSLQNVVCA